MNLYVGDNGTILNITIRDSEGVVNLTDANVTLKIQNKDNYTSKVANVTNAAKGECQVVLTESELNGSGRYIFQVHCEFLNQNEFSSNINQIFVYSTLKEALL